MQPLGTGHCHILIARTAQGIAGAKYELVMFNDILYKEWKEKYPGLNAKALERKFIESYWGNCVDEARATLAQMLNGNYPTDLKDQIADALIKDHALRRGLKAPIGQA